MRFMKTNSCSLLLAAAPAVVTPPSLLVLHPAGCAAAPPDAPDVALGQLDAEALAVSLEQVSGVAGQHGAQQSLHARARGLHGFQGLQS